MCSDQATYTIVRSEIILMEQKCPRYVRGEPFLRMLYFLAAVARLCQHPACFNLRDPAGLGEMKKTSNEQEYLVTGCSF